MKKQVLLDSNNAIRTDPDFIEPAEDADNRDKHVLNAYGDIRNENSNSPSWTLPNSSSTRPYQVIFVKQGRIVTAFIWFRQTAGTEIPPSRIFKLEDVVSGNASDLLPDDTIDFYTDDPFLFRGYAETPGSVTPGTGTRIQVCIGKRIGDGSPAWGNGFYTLDNIPPNTTTESVYYAVIQYPTKE